MKIQLTDSPTGIKFQNAEDTTLQDDLKCAIDLDRFPFALQVHKENDCHILRPVTP